METDHPNTRTEEAGTTGPGNRHPTLDCEVLIVGGGPVGLSAAIELGSRGIDVVVVERHRSTSVFPKARLLTTRTMELCREWGLHDEVEAAGMPREFSLALGIGDTLTSPEFRHEVARISDDEPQSPTYSYICTQDRFEQILLRRARELESVDIRFSTAFAGLTDHGDHVEAVLAPASAGADGITDGADVARTVRAQYVIGADGHRSRVRDVLGATTVGPDPMGNMMAIMFDADLEALLEHRRGALYFLHGDFYCVVESVDNAMRWTLQTAYEPEAGEHPDDYTDEHCVELVRAAVGVPDLDVEIVGRMPWTQQVYVADDFGRGRVFLAGDAAHVATPQGGFGMNCGIQDAHNLAWKIAAVLRGAAGPRLLDSYEPERRPVAQWTIDESLRNAIITLDMMEDRLSVEEAGDLQAVRRRSEGLVLGYHYSSDAVLPDGTAAPTPDDPYLDYIPSARPGHLIPHHWLDSGGSRVSTKDLLGPTGLTLLAADAGWRTAADAVGTSGPALGVVVIGDGPGANVCDPGGVDGGVPWAEVFGVGSGGAVLVRPDGHVAWRSRTLPDADGLREAVRSVLSLV